MKTIHVMHNQNLFDLAVQLQGNVCSVFEIAIENNISISDALQPGVQLELKKNTLEYNEDVSKYFFKKNQLIATDNLPAINQFMFIQTLPFIL